MTDADIDVDGPPVAPPAQPPRARWRWLRRIGATVVVLMFVATTFSVIFNAATDARASAQGGLTYVQTGDVNTRYRQWGERGSPVVLVHGFAESADTWQDVGSRLAASGHRVYAIDLVGWGYSQRVAPFDRHHQSAQLAAFIQAIGLQKPVLVGHSSGAAIVATTALEHPAEVGGLLFLDGDALATGAGQRTPLTRLFLDPWRTTMLRLVLRSDWLIRGVYSAQCGPQCPELDAAGLDQWRRPMRVEGAESALWAMIRLGVPGLPTAQLARLAQLPFPKRVVFGADDSSYSRSTPTDTAKLIGAPAPTIIPNAAHLTPVNSPDIVAAEIARLAS